jgi:hypothetical protein
VLIGAKIDEAKTIFVDSFTALATEFCVATILFINLKFAHFR